MNKNSMIYFLALDTEDRGNHDPYLFALYGQIQTQRGIVKDIDIITDNIYDIIEILNMQVVDTYLIGFNLSYDLNAIYPQYNRKQRTWKGKFAGFEGDKKKIRGIEMLGKWFQRVSLKELSEKFGVEYIDEHDEKDPNIKAACRSHAKSIYEITAQLEKLFNELDYSMLYAKRYMPTASGMAFYVWKQMTKQDTEKWDKSQNLLAGLSYHGGWCDIFKKGLEKKVFHYDVVSMYPSVMKNHAYPNPNIPFIKGKPEELKQLVMTKAGFATGIITIESYTISPFAQKDDHKLLFPLGSWHTSITFPELQYLWELGGSFKCDSVYYTDIWQPFNEYVDKWYELKKQKKYKEVAKLFLNGLSGKFGQKVRPEGEYVLIDPSEINDIPSVEAGIKTFYVCGNQYEYLKPGSDLEQYSYYPLISAYITAYSRIKLHKMMMLLGLDNIIYCDTDSIVSSVPMPEEYIAKDKELGKWELEGVVDFYGIAPKKYKEFKDGKWFYKANGIPNKMQEQYWKDPSQPIKYKQPMSFKMALRRHMLPNQWVDVIKVSSLEPKRIFHEDGSSEPFKYNENIKS